MRDVKNEKKCATLKMKIRFYIMSLWLLFVLIFLLMVDISICFGAGARFIGIVPLLRRNWLSFPSLIMAIWGLVLASIVMEELTKLFGNRGEVIEIILRNAEAQHQIRRIESQRVTHSHNCRGNSVLKDCSHEIRQADVEDQRGHSHKNIHTQNAHKRLRNHFPSGKTFNAASSV